MTQQRCSVMANLASDFFAAFIVTLAIMVPDVSCCAQQPVGDKANISPDEPDKLYSRKRKQIEELQSRIKIANGVVITLENGDQRQTKDYEIRFWNGVTNAADYYDAARPQLEAIKTVQDQIRFTDIDNERQRLVNAASRASRALSPIKKLSADQIQDLPSCRDFSPQDRNVLLAIINVYQNLNAVAKELPTLMSQRRQIKSLRGQLIQASNSLKNGRFRDLQADCEALAKKLSNTSSKIDREFYSAAGQLGSMAPLFSSIAPLEKRLPTGPNLRAARTNVENGIKALENRRLFLILGTDFVAERDDLLQRYLKLKSDIDETIRLQQPIEAIHSSWNGVEKSVANGGFASVDSLNEQISRIRVTLQQERDRLSKADKSRAVNVTLSMVDRLSSEISVRQPLLELKIDLKLSADFIASKPGATSEESALRLADEWKRAHKRMAAYQRRKDIERPERVILDARIASLSQGVIEYQDEAFRFFLADVDSELRNVMNEHSTLVAKVERNNYHLDEFSRLRNALGEQSDRLQSRLKQEPGRANLAKRTTDVITTADMELDQRIRLLTVQKEHSFALPAVAEVHDVDVHETRIVDALTELSVDKPFDDKVQPDTDTPLGRIAQLYEQTRVFLQLRRIEIRKLRIQSYFSLAEKTLSDGHTASADVALAEVKPTIAAFPELAENAELGNDTPPMMEWRQEFEEQRMALCKQVAVQRRKERTEAGWVTLPQFNPSSEQPPTQLPPTAKSRLLLIRCLMAAGNTNEAEDQLQTLVDAHPGSVAPEQVEAIRNELKLVQTQILQEADEQNAEVRKQYRNLSLKDGLVGKAASIALRRMDERQRQAINKAGQFQRATIIGSFAAFMILIAFVSARSESMTARLRHASQLLSLYRGDAGRENSRRMKRIRQQVAFNLASLPEDHPDVRRLEESLDSVGPKPSVEAKLVTDSHDPVPVHEELTLTEVVAGIVNGSSEASEDVIAPVLEWLTSKDSRHRKQRKLRVQAITWARQSLKPCAADEPELLRAKVAAASALKREGTRADPWPALYELRGLMMLEDWSAALESAQTVDLNKSHNALIAEAVVAIGRSLVEQNRWDEAEKWLRAVVRKRPSVASSEVTYWLNLATARRTIASGTVMNSKQLRQFLEST